MGTPSAQLSLDGADRLVERLRVERAPLPVGEAARALFALRTAPAALVHQLVDEVVAADARLIWRSGREIALAEWEEAGSLLDRPLESAPYVIFDLETTGTRPGTARIVEVGAVRMRGFEVLDRFQRLVDPGVPMPITITRITGLQTRDLRGAPRIERVLPEFLDFAAGAVLVAHNASFDVGFVDAELSRLRGRRLAAPVLDTVMLARRLLAGRLPRMNLGTLAERFETSVRPCHRALPDAEATAEVLAALLGLAQERGARTVAEAIALAGPPRRAASRRRDLARDVPTGPGVYLFRDTADRVLYVGKATDLRARVRSYFSGSPQRRAVEHALAATARVESRPLGSELEAALVELELIGRLRPAANSRNAHPERACYLTLSHADPVPRLTITARAQPGAATLGPLPSKAEALRAAAALRDAFRLRSCRPALPDDESGCLAGVLGRCHAPCRGGEAVSAHAHAAAELRAWMTTGDDCEPVRMLRLRMTELAAAQRFEEAASMRDGLEAIEGVHRRAQRLRRAARWSGVLLAADVDDRFVQAFACARGRVVARRRLPRAGDAALEIAPLVLAIDTGTAGTVPPFDPHEAEAARIVAAAFARPGNTVAAVPWHEGRSGPAAIGAARASVRFRR